MDGSSEDDQISQTETGLTVRSVGWAMLTLQIWVRGGRNDGKDRQDRMDRLYQQRGSNAFYVCFGTVSPFGPFGRLGIGWVTMFFIFILAVLE